MALLHWITIIYFCLLHHGMFIFFLSQEKKYNMHTNCIKMQIPVNFENKILFKELKIVIFCPFFSLIWIQKLLIFLLIALKYIKLKNMTPVYEKSSEITFSLNNPTTIHDQFQQNCMIQFCWLINMLTNNSPNILIF